MYGKRSFFTSLLLLGLTGCNGCSGSITCEDSGLFEGACDSGSRSGGIPAPPPAPVPREGPLLMSFDMLGGQIREITSPTIGGGLEMGWLGRVVILDRTGNQVLLTSRPPGQAGAVSSMLIAVDLDSGDRTLVSNYDVDREIDSAVDGCMDESRNEAILQAGDSSIIGIDIATGRRRHIYKAGADSSGHRIHLALDAANDRLFFGPVEEFQIAVIDLASGVVSVVTDLPEPLRAPYIIGYDPARDVVVVTFDSGKLAEIDATTGTVDELAVSVSTKILGIDGYFIEPFRPEVYDSRERRVIGMHRWNSLLHFPSDDVPVASSIYLPSGAITEHTAYKPRLMGYTGPAYDPTTERLYFAQN